MEEAVKSLKRRLEALEREAAECKRLVLSMPELKKQSDEATR